MYYKEYDKKNYFYRDFIVKMINNMSYFHWENVSNKTFAPKLFVSDLDNDSLDELIIELCTGHGTGLYSGEIHVLKENPKNNTLNELLVESPLIILHKNVKVTDNLQYLELVIKDRTITINKDNYPYDVFLGELVASYTLKDHIYQMKDIELNYRLNFSYNSYVSLFKFFIQIKADSYKICFLLFIL